MPVIAPTGEQLATTLETLYYLAHHYDPDGDAYQSLVDSLNTTAGELMRTFPHPPGLQVREMPYSEVCMHMKIAGKLMWTCLLRSEGPEMVQLYDLATGRLFSAPITKGEAGYHMIDPVVA